jgi:c-di-GMP phosphodiesterase Gmr
MPLQARPSRIPPFPGFHVAFNQNEAGNADSRRMQNSDRHNFSSRLTEAGSASAELSLLRDVLKMLPTGVTVQDEHGRLVLINDAAAAQLTGGTDARDGTLSPLEQRR